MGYPPKPFSNPLLLIFVFVYPNVIVEQIPSIGNDEIAIDYNWLILYPWFFVFIYFWFKVFLYLWCLHFSSPCCWMSLNGIRFSSWRHWFSWCIWALTGLSWWVSRTGAGRWWGKGHCRCDECGFSCSWSLLDRSSLHCVQDWTNYVRNIFHSTQGSGNPSLFLVSSLMIWGLILQ